MARGQRQVAELIAGRPIIGKRLAWITPLGWQPSAGGSAGSRLLAGSGNQFAGMGAYLARRFPQILQRQQQENEHLASQFCDSAWLRGELSPTSPDIKQADFIMGQVTTGTIGWDALQLLGVEAEHLVPSSLGESALMFSTRTWRERDEMWRRCHAGTLFSKDLGAPYTAVQQYLGTEAKIDWRVVTIPVSADRVRSGLAELKRNDVWLGIVNAPEECVLVGLAEGVQAAQQHLACQGIELSGITSVHAPVLKPVEQAYYDLHHFPVHLLPKATYYSCYHGHDYVPTSDNIPASIVGNACEGFDYDKLINAVYAKGARVFIDCGPGHSSARLVQRILGQRPHVACAMQADVDEPARGFLAMVAQLVCANVRVNLDVLRPAQPQPAKFPLVHQAPVIDLSACTLPSAPIQPAPTSSSVSTPVTAPAPTRPAPCHQPRACEPHDTFICRSFF